MEGIFFPSNARWLSPGRLSSRKDNCSLQIHRINAVATMAWKVEKGAEVSRLGALLEAQVIGFLLKPP